MNEVLLSNGVIVYLISEAILFLLLTVAFMVSLKILIKWDFESFNPMQFSLEKHAYLVNTIIFFVFALKFLLVIYFVFSIDALATLVPGAMCGAGVITANEYGIVLLRLKLMLLSLLTLWLYINFYDMRTKDYSYLKLKSWLFSLIFLLVLLELFLDFKYFSNIDTHLPVSCCSTLFGQLEGVNPLPFGLTIPLLLVLFYLLYLLLLITLEAGYKIIYVMVNLSFVYVAYYAVVYFFGTYIYQLPTHKCPFCMLQAEYFYVGYLLWGSLFLGTFMGVSDVVTSLWFKKEKLKHQKIVTLLLSFFVLLCTLYVAIYYFRNGVFL